MNFAHSHNLHLSIWESKWNGHLSFHLFCIYASALACSRAACAAVLSGVCVCGGGAVNVGKNSTWRLMRLCPQGFALQLVSHVTFVFWL